MDTFVDKIKQARNGEKEELVLRRLSDVRAKKVDWLIHPMLAKGKLTIFHGEPGKGKSQASIYVASLVSNGGTYIDGQVVEKGEVLFITAEDDAADTLKPRLMACGADVNNIHELQWFKNKEGKIKMFNLEEHIPQLKDKIAELPNLKLIIIDPISAFLGKVDGNNSSGVRGLFAEIKTITDTLGCAVLIIAHHNKTSGQKTLNKISGSISFGAAARVSYIFGSNPNHTVIEDMPGKFIMAQSKNNLEKEEVNSQEYDIEGAEVEENGQVIKTSKIKWGMMSTMTSQEIVDYMPNKKTAGRPNEKRQECIDEIVNFMNGKQSLTPVETKAIKTHLGSMGFDEQMQRRSRQEIGIRVVQIDNEFCWTTKPEISLFD
jgi:putative DNA primase/helicase